MLLSELKTYLVDQDKVTFTLPDGGKVPAHYHVTEVGKITKHFIDCGGTVREEAVVNLQLWYSVDITHRLKADKLLSILELSERKLNMGDHEIEVEYQANTIGKYGLEIGPAGLKLTTKQTDCLAKSDCAVPGLAKVQEQVTQLAETIKQEAAACCTPGGGCC